VLALGGLCGCALDAAACKQPAQRAW
jgi:hypothetical protein